jgi:hypothetical protein
LRAGPYPLNERMEPVVFRQRARREQRDAPSLREPR